MNFLSKSFCINLVDGPIDISDFGEILVDDSSVCRENNPGKFQLMTPSVEKIIPGNFYIINITVQNLKFASTNILKIPNMILLTLALDNFEVLNLSSISSQNTKVIKCQIWLNHFRNLHHFKQKQISVDILEISIELIWNWMSVFYLVSSFCKIMFRLRKRAKKVGRGGWRRYQKVSCFFHWNKNEALHMKT